MDEGKEEEEEEKERWMIGRKRRERWMREEKVFNADDVERGL